MKNNLIMTFGFLLLVVACKQEEDKKPAEIESKPTTELKNETAEKNEQSEQFIENDNLASAWLNQINEISKSDFNFKVSKEPYVNTHDETIIDTIKTLTFDKSKIIFYAGQSFEGVISAEIENSEITLSDNIKIGMKKSDLEKLLGVRIKSDLLKIGDFDQTTLFTFNFEYNKLKSIKLEGYVD